jgi:hypothetical protein
MATVLSERATVAQTRTALTASRPDADFFTIWIWGFNHTCAETTRSSPKNVNLFSQQAETGSTSGTRSFKRSLRHFAEFQSGRRLFDQERPAAAAIGGAVRHENEGRGLFHWFPGIYHEFAA